MGLGKRIRSRSLTRVFLLLPHPPIRNPDRSINVLRVITHLPAVPAPVFVPVKSLPTQVHGPWPEHQLPHACYAVSVWGTVEIFPGDSDTGENGSPPSAGKSCDLTGGHERPDRQHPDTRLPCLSCGSGSSHRMVRCRPGFPEQRDLPFHHCSGGRS